MACHIPYRPNYYIKPQNTHHHQKQMLQKTVMYLS